MVTPAVSRYACLHRVAPHDLRRDVAPDSGRRPPVHYGGERFRVIRAGALNRVLQANPHSGCPPE